MKQSAHGQPCADCVYPLGLIMGQKGRRIGCNRESEASGSKAGVVMPIKKVIGTFRHRRQ